MKKIILILITGFVLGIQLKGQTDCTIILNCKEFDYYANGLIERKYYKFLSEIQQKEIFQYIIKENNLLCILENDSLQIEKYKKINVSFESEIQTRNTERISLYLKNTRQKAKIKNRNKIIFISASLNALLITYLSLSSSK